MATLVEWHVLTSAIGGIVGGMAVIRRHSMPEGAYRAQETEMSL